MPDRTTALITAGLVLLLLGCDPGAEGRRAYDAGRFEDAAASFAEVAEAEGGGASAKLLHDLGLAALRAGDLRTADRSAREAAGRGDPDVASCADFLRAAAAYARCELAERQAEAVEAEPFALDLAIRYGEDAQNLWRAAAMSRSDWPEARRNAERARLKVEALRRKRTDPEGRSERRPEPRPRPEPGPRPEPEEPGPDSALTELSPEQVRELYRKLEEKEREKVALRREERKARTADVEKDW